MDDRREKILNIVADLVSNFLYYDRKEDEDMGVGEIDSAIIKGEITIDEIVSHFKKNLIEHI